MKCKWACQFHKDQALRIVRGSVAQCCRTSSVGMKAAWEGIPTVS